MNDSSKMEVDGVGWVGQVCVPRLYLGPVLSPGGESSSKAQTERPSGPRLLQNRL